MIVFQEIITIWSKQSRGAPVATRRNAVPDVYPLPSVAVAPSQGTCLHHSVVFREADTFAHPEEQTTSPTLTNAYRSSCISIFLVADQLQVVYTYDMCCGGAPQRYGLPQLVFTLQQNQWGQICYNGRFAEEYTWIYRKHVCNIAIVEMSDQHVFMHHPPTYVQDRLVTVW